MSRQSAIDFLTSKTEEYEYRGQIGITRGGEDFQQVFGPACEHPMWHTGYDAWGVHWTQADPATHRTPGQEPILVDPENWRNEVHIPDPAKFDWSELEEQARHLDRENKVIATTLTIGPFERINLLCSFEDGLVFALTDTDSYAEMLDAFADYKIDLIKRIADIAHPDLFNIHDDWGTAQNLFLRPEMWREIIKPYVTRIVDAIHETGAIASFHSCGHVEDLIPDMIDCGIDVWECNAFCNNVPADEKAYEGKIRIIAPPDKKEDADNVALASKGIAPEKKPIPAYETVMLADKSFQEQPTWLWA